MVEYFNELEIQQDPKDQQDQKKPLEDLSDPQNSTIAKAMRFGKRPAEFSFKNNFGVTVRIDTIKYSDDGSIQLFTTPYGRTIYFDPKTQKWCQTNINTGKAVEDTPQLGKVFLQNDGLHANGKDADIAGNKLRIPIIDEFESSAPKDALQKQYTYVKALQVLTSDKELFADKEKNGHLTKDELKNALNHFRHHTEGYFGLKQVLNNFDQLASTQNGLSKQDIEKELDKERMDCFINHISKTILSDLEKSNIGRLFIFDYSDNKKVDQFAKDINTELAKRNLKWKISFDPVNEKEDTFFDQNRMMNIHDANGVIVNQIPVAVTRIR